MKGESVKVSIVMSVYNGASFLRNTIESVLNQTYTNFEFLITDNASSDETVSIIKSYKDTRIMLVINKENKGYVANINTMIKKSSGKYICRQDADDIIRKDKISKLVNFMENHQEVGACGYYVNIFGSSKGKNRYELEDKKIRSAMLFENQMDSLSMIRASLFEKLNFDESFIPTEDYKFWFEVMKCSKLANIPHYLLDYRVHGTNTSIEKKDLGDRNRLEVQTQIFEYLFNTKINDDQKEALRILYNDVVKDKYEYKIISSELETMAKLGVRNDNLDKKTFISYLSKRWFIFCLRNNIKYLFYPNFIKITHFITFVINMIIKKA